MSIEDDSYANEQLFKAVLILATSTMDLRSRIQRAFDAGLHVLINGPLRPEIRSRYQALMEKFPQGILEAADDDECARVAAEILSIYSEQQAASR